jgi:hypothetical protein
MYILAVFSFDVVALLLSEWLSVTGYKQPIYLPLFNLLLMLPLLCIFFGEIRNVYSL